MHVIQLQFTQTNPLFFSKGGGGARRAGPGSTFALGKATGARLLCKDDLILITIF